MRTRIYAVVAALGLAALSLAAFDGFTIKSNPKVGDVHKYKQTGKFEVGGQEFDFEGIAAQKIVKVETTGNYIQEETTTDVKINGQDQPVTNGTTTTTYTPKGEVIEIKGDMVNASVYRFTNLSLFIVPDKDLKAGDTWSYEGKADPKLGSVALKATYTLVGEDKLDTTDTLKVKYSIKETGSDAASSEGTVWLKKSDSTMLKLVGKLINAPAPGQPIVLSGDITLSLIQ